MSVQGASPSSKIPLERDDHGRPRFHGCSNIRDYDFMGKLGEGTFGYTLPFQTVSGHEVNILQRGVQGAVKKERFSHGSQEDSDA